MVLLYHRHSRVLSDVFASFGGDGNFSLEISKSLLSSTRCFRKTFEIVKVKIKAVLSMAQEARFQPIIKWKLGSQCELFDSETRKWAVGEIIGSFSDEKGEWVKVRCDEKMHHVLSDDPCLRERDQNTMPSDWIDKLKKLKQAFLTRNAVDTATILEQLLSGTDAVATDPTKGTQNAIIHTLTQWHTVSLSVHCRTTGIDVVEGDPKRLNSIIPSFIGHDVQVRTGKARFRYRVQTE